MRHLPRADAADRPDSAAARPDPRRRRLLQALLSTALLQAAAWPTGMRRAVAAPGERPRAAFRAQTLAEALDALGIAGAARDGVLQLRAPARAENGAVVPLKVEASEPVSAVNVLCAGNPVPMIARFELSPRVRGRLSTRIKMGESADITVIAEGAGGLHRADLGVEVTIGGCD